MMGISVWKGQRTEIFLAKKICLAGKIAFTSNKHYTWDHTKPTDQRINTKPSNKYTSTLTHKRQPLDTINGLYMGWKIKAKNLRVLSSWGETNDARLVNTTKIWVSKWHWWRVCIFCGDYFGLYRVIVWDDHTPPIFNLAHFSERKCHTVPHVVEKNWMIFRWREKCRILSKFEFEVGWNRPEDRGRAHFTLSTSMGTGIPGYHRWMGTHGAAASIEHTTIDHSICNF